MGNTCHKNRFKSPLLQEAHEICIGASPPGKADVVNIMKNRWSGNLIQQHPTLSHLYLFQIYRENATWLVYISLDGVSKVYQDQLFSIIKKDNTYIIDFNKIIQSPDQYSVTIYRSKYLFEINDISVNEELRIFFNDLGETI